MILFVNKNHIFNESMIDNLEMVEYENFQEKTLFIEINTYEHFRMLQAHLKIDGVQVDITDAYRSLETQENLFLKYMNRYGMDAAENMVAMPGTSDHHTGQALDIAIYKDDVWVTDETDLLKEEEIFDKIHSCLKYFGFIVRYPKNKESITCYSYKPWHIRYIGEKNSMEIGDLTLEEYLDNGKK